MPIKPQSIRKGTTIKLDGKEVTKQEFLAFSETWEPKHVTLFNKLIKQGGGFTIKGTYIQITPPEKTLTSKGEADGGVNKVDPLARF
jgi:hypothetical protein